MEQLCRNVRIHNHNFHFICMQRLMTSRWQKQLLKVSDLCITMPFDSINGPESNFEPLIIAIVLPFFSLHPWKLNNTKLVRGCERNLQEVWKDDFFLGRNLLRELQQSARSLESIPKDLVRRYYHSAEIDNHRIIKPQEEYGFELELDKDKGRHLFTRDGITK